MDKVEQNHHVAWVRCFLCRHRRQQHFVRPIHSCVCPTSKKPIKEVLLFLARFSETEVHISQKDHLCTSCVSQIVQYDTALVRMLRMQKDLCRLIGNTAVSIDSDFEEECKKEMASIEDMESELLDFGDLSEVSEGEIEQTVNDAMGKRRVQRKKRKFCESEFKQISLEQMDDNLMPCNFCAMRFENKEKLHAHLLQSHQRYACELCPFTHKNDDYVMLHMNVHEGKGENECRYCGKTFTTRMGTIRHMEVHLDSKKYQCDKCGLCFSQTTILYNHRLQHEAEENPLRCDICSQLFKTIRTYRHHMITHREDRPRHRCDICGKTFTEKYTLKIHKRLHANHNANELESHDTPQQTVEVVTTTAPVLATANKSQNSKFQCIICEQVFSNKDLLNKHMETDHDVILMSLAMNEITQSCHVCGEELSMATSLDTHLLQAHGLVFK